MNANMMNLPVVIYMVNYSANSYGETTTADAIEKFLLKYGISTTLVTSINIQITKKSVRYSNGS